MVIHYTDSYLLNPQHKITVNLIGLGGTGSSVLSCLARLNEALVGMGHPGIHVYAWDADAVTATNIGRQKFTPADLGVNKAVCLITRVNRAYGNDWEAMPEMYRLGHHHRNITISCVDTVKARLDIEHNLKKGRISGEPTQKALYWIDFGNLHKIGQVVLGTCSTVKQPKSKHQTVGKLNTVIEELPGLRKMKDKTDMPSCSMAEALGKQDLFINSSLAELGITLLWNLFREGFLLRHGLYLNLETMCVNPIKVKA